MFFKKKFQKIAEQNRHDFSVEIEKLQNDMKAADAIPDAARRLFALIDLEKEIERCRRDIYQKASQMDEVAKKAAAKVHGMGTFIAFGGVALMSFNPFFALICMPGLGVSIASINTRYAGYKAAVESSSVFSNFLDAASANINTKKEAILQNSLDELAVSGRFDEICDRFPAAAAAFAKSAARERILQRHSVRPGKPAAPKE